MGSIGLEIAECRAGSLARARSSHQASTSHSRLAPSLSASHRYCAGENFAGQCSSGKQTESRIGCTPSLARLCDPPRSSRRFQTPPQTSLSPKFGCKRLPHRLEQANPGFSARRRLDVRVKAAAGEAVAQGDNPKVDVLPVEVELSWRPPKWAWRALSAILTMGQVAARILRGKIHWKNTLEQLAEVGPGSLGVCLLTSSFVGMVFTIQFVREFARLGLTRSVGGVLALALSRELTPVVTAIILAGRVGSAFAAELGTMQVSEQTDTLRVLRTDPVDYLITPRVIACSIAMPCLTVFCFTVGMAASVLLADAVYNVSSNIILDSAARALNRWDLISTLIKSWIFGVIISVISCSWGVTTNGGAKGVGESTTSAVVISLVVIFIADFILSFLFFQGAGDSLKAALG